MQDCWWIVFQFLFYKSNDFYTIRLICKEFLSISKLLWFRPCSKIFPPSTFVDTRYCYICNDKSNRHKSVPYGTFPRGLYCYCDKFECTRIVIRSLVENAKENNIVLLLSEAVKEEGMCPRSNGAMSKCIFIRGWLWRSGYVRCIVDSGIKDVPLDQIQSKYKYKYKILKL